jgi:hypothetical protein
VVGELIAHGDPGARSAHQGAPPRAAEPLALAA